MIQEAPQPKNPIYKFGRRHFGKLAVVTAVAAVLETCELTREKSRVDQALAIFSTSDLSTETGWTTYDHSKFFPVKLDIPPTWNVEALTVHEGGLSNNGYTAFAIRKPDVNQYYDVLVRREPVSAGWTQEKDDNNYLHNLELSHTEDVRVTKVRFSGQETKMISFFSRESEEGFFIFYPRQRHNVSFIKEGVRWEMEFKGSQDFVIAEMPRFRRMVDSFQILG